MKRHKKSIRDIKKELKEKVEDNAKAAYELYCKEVGGLAFNGDKLPTWEVFRNDSSKTKQIKAWLKIGEMVYNAYIIGRGSVVKTKNQFVDDEESFS